MDWPGFLNRLRDLLELGKAQGAREQLSGLTLRRVPRRYAVDLANLARRLGDPFFALKILGPVVSPKKSSTAPAATAKERAVYAASLVPLGGTEEALTILSELMPEEFPQASIFLAHAHFATWDYAAAIPVLERCLAADPKDREVRVLAELNLAAALVFERHDARAGKLLRKLAGFTMSHGRMALLGNVLELSAQLAIAGEHWDHAKELLDQANGILAAASGLDRLYARKWTALLNLRRSGPTEEVRREWRAVFEKATQQGHYETLRDMDLRWGLATGDTTALWRTYFGSPWQAFRERIFRESKGSLTVPDGFDWNLGPEGKREIVAAKSLATSANGVSGRIFAALLTDFYRPFSVVRLHTLIYPGEFFSPQSSPSRVHQAVYAARQWLAEQKLPVQIQQEDEAYRLGAETPCAVRMALASEPIHRDEDRIGQLLEHFGGRSFDVKQAAEVLGISPRSVNRLVGVALADHRLEKQGAGKGTTYHFRKKAG